MATQQDLQELLRLMTGRKIPMITAMGQIKALQTVNLRRRAPLSHLNQSAAAARE